jgi:hypothetical protein
LPAAFLREAFGATEFDDIHVIKDLASSKVFRMIFHGLAHWERLLQNVQQARYKEALKLISGA